MKKFYVLQDVLGNVYTTGKEKFTQEEIKDIEEEAGQGLYQMEVDRK